MPLLSSPGSAPARLPAWRLIALVSIAIPVGGAFLPLAVYLPAHYAQTLGLTVVGAVFLATRIWDAFSDPLMGLLSDRTRSRFGRRKPWIAAGSVVLAAAIFALFFPSGPVSTLYLGGWLFAFYLGVTMVQIPLDAWCGGLSTGYHERSRIQTYLLTAGSLGYLAVLVIPTFLEQTGRAAPGGSLRAEGLFSLILLAPAVVAALTLVPEPAPLGVEVSRPSLKTVIGAIFGDRLLLRILASDFAVRLAQSIRSALFVFFVVAYLGLPKWASALFLFQFVFGVFAGPIWLRIGYRLGKSRAAALGETVQVVINLGLLFASPGAFGWVLALTVAQGLAQGSGNLMLKSMVADLVDKQALESGQNRAGVLFSSFTVSDKLATAAAVGIALPLVAAFGFHAGAHNTPSALLGLKLVFALGPAVAHAVSAAVILRFPFNEDRHAQVQAALADRALRAPALALAAAE
jgi:Na+/melibiose symporter-like transporter